MHRRTLAAPAAALVLVLLSGRSVEAGAPEPAAAEADAKAKAARLLARDDAPGAIDVLEAALPVASAAERTALLDRLADAYDAAARNADAAGRREEAEAFRDNLDILRRKPRGNLPAPAEAPPAENPPAPPTARPGPAAPVAPPLEAPRRPKEEEEDAFDKVPVLADGEPAPVAALPEPAALPPAPPVAAAVPARREPGRAAETDRPAKSAPAGSLKDADAAFLAGRYEEAGRVYASLARDRNLPDGRHPHWAYCRAVSVVERINNRPRTAAEWAAIDAEIVAIRALSPSNWFAEYLRNLASERSRTAKSPRGRSDSRVVVRGSSPEEGSSPRRAKAPQPSAAPGAAPRPEPAGRTRLPGSQVDWNGRPVTSANFQVYYTGDDPGLADRVARAAEQARTAQMKRWGGVAPGGVWTPRCEILLYPNPRDFGQDTHQPADSPGFSSMGMNAGRVVFRRIHLRADHATLEKAILPHEITHVVLADLFPHEQVPRWADEGLAVLAEPPSEQAVRAADLDDPLKTGTLFRLSDLMVMDYPDPKHWSLYYAQSVSLTRFLVDSGTPAQFIKFVRQSQASGFEPALRDVYEIKGYGELQTRWLAFARERASGDSAVTASATEEGTVGESVRR